MDNCLASSSDTGGVGCDNMTIVIVALLRGKTKEEWYDMIVKRVADGDGPCAPPEYGKSLFILIQLSTLPSCPPKRRSPYVAPLNYFYCSSLSKLTHISRVPRAGSTQRL